MAARQHHQSGGGDRSTTSKAGRSCRPATGPPLPAMRPATAWPWGSTRTRVADRPRQMSCGS